MLILSNGAIFGMKTAKNYTYRKFKLVGCRGINVGNPTVRTCCDNVNFLFWLFSLLYSSVKLTYNILAAHYMINDIKPPPRITQITSTFFTSKPKATNVNMILKIFQ